MAKRKAKKAIAEVGKPKYHDEKPAKGPYRQCPDCQAWTHGRSAKCGKCGRAFPMKRAKRKNRKAAVADNGMAANVAKLGTTVKFVEAVGGVEKANILLATLSALQEKIGQE